MTDPLETPPESSSPKTLSSPKALPRSGSLTSTMSLTSLTSSSYLPSTVYSSTLEKPFKITIEAVHFIGAETTVQTSYSKYDIQIGLFHGARPLCSLKTISLLKKDSENQEVEFDITVSNVPRMAKLCFGLFEKKKNNPSSWVNANVFDYKVQYINWGSKLLKGIQEQCCIFLID